MAMVWMNGSFVEEAGAGVSVRDMGLLHAAGVFTTMRGYGGKVFRVGEHVKRVRGSCAAMGIPLGYSDEQLEHVVGQVLEKNELREARLRLTVTRGKASGEEMEATVFLTATELVAYPEDYYRKGLTVAVEDRQKLNPYDVQAGHKTLNYFSRLAALKVANQRGAGEAMWFDVHNYLQSGSISNVFVVSGGKVVTPATQGEMGEEAVKGRVPYERSCVLPGVTRGVVMELCRKEGIAVEAGAVDINGLLGADEVFVTNSIMGVMPVCRIERKAVGKEKPAEVTVRLMEAYAKEVEALAASG